MQRTLEERRANKEKKNEIRRKKRKEVNLEYEKTLDDWREYERRHRDKEDYITIPPPPIPPREELRALESSPETSPEDRPPRPLPRSRVITYRPTLLPGYVPAPSRERTPSPERTTPSPRRRQPGGSYMPEYTSHTMGGTYSVIEGLAADYCGVGGVTVKSVEEGGIFDQAGLKEYDKFDMKCAELGFFSAQKGRLLCLDTFINRGGKKIDLYENSPRDPFSWASRLGHIETLSSELVVRSDRVRVRYVDRVRFHKDDRGCFSRRFCF